MKMEVTMRHKLEWLPILLAGLSLAAGPTDRLKDPYGVCAHVSRENPSSAPTQFSRMHKAAINWVRTDYDWSNVEKKRDSWNFDHLDKLFQLAKQDKINILPILDYDVPWATPAYKHLDAWGEYVRRVVSRYSGYLRYWEVWNEQNAEGFWREKPSGKNYTLLLRRSYEQIKKIDPGLVVVYGGTAGVPFDFIEESYAAGAGRYFDVMNIHPYHWQGTPEWMIPQLNDLRALMKKYQLDKPIWITEVGWSTARPSGFYREVLPAAFERAGINPAESTLGMIHDPENGYPLTQEYNIRQSFSNFGKIEPFTFAQLDELDPEKCRVVIPSVGEAFPARYLPVLVRYVKRGGTLLLPSGLPFYYDLRPAAQGGIQKVQVNDRYLPDLHIGWDAWWTRKGVPMKETYQRPAPEFTGKFKVKFSPTGRFLHDRNLHPGDQFIPVVEAGTDNYKSAVVALYKLDSNLKGNIIVCTSMSASETVSEERQAQMLPRTYLIAFGHGVERVFWYNFRSAEWSPDDREAHFGIVGKDLKPKPAFAAYQTLTKLCPAGSTVPEFQQKNGVYLTGWRRPDGVGVWAIWAADTPIKTTLQIRGKVTEALDHLGEKQPIPESTCTAGPSILYLVGPESVTVR